MASRIPDPAATRQTPPKAPAIIAAAVLIALPITAGQEGFVRKAAPDPAHIPTYCYGETENVDPTRVYSKSECMDLLGERLANSYAPKVLACLPELSDPRRRDVFAALIDASYNAGPPAVCKSPMAAKIRASDWVGACAAFVGWYTSARDRKSGIRKQLPGLVKRRRDVEAPLCLKGAALPPPIAARPQAARPAKTPPQAAPQAPAHPPAPKQAPRAASLLERLIAFVRHWLGI